MADTTTHPTPFTDPSPSVTGTAPHTGATRTLAYLNAATGTDPIEVVAAAAYALTQGWTPVIPGTRDVAHGGDCPVGPRHHGHPRACWYAAGIRVLQDCRLILLIPGWDTCRDARLQFLVAVHTNLPVEVLDPADTDRPLPDLPPPSAHHLPVATAHPGGAPVVLEHTDDPDTPPRLNVHAAVGSHPETTTTLDVGGDSGDHPPGHLNAGARARTGTTPAPDPFTNGAAPAGAGPVNR